MVSKERRLAISAKLNNLTEDDRKVIGPVLQKFAHVCFEEGVCEFSSTKIMTHGIETGDAASIRKAPCRVPFCIETGNGESDTRLIRQGYNSGD
jgi:hypothetical protein